MANVIRKSDIKYFTSKDITKPPWNNTTDFIHYTTPAAIATLEAQLAAIIPKYRKLVGADVVEMDAGEKAAADQAEQDAADAAQDAFRDLDNFDERLRATALALGKNQGLTEGQIKTLIKNEF